MMTGILTARLSGASEALGRSHSGFPHLTLPTAGGLGLGIFLIAASGSIMIVLRAALTGAKNSGNQAVSGKEEPCQSPVEFVADCIEGFLFSMSLAYAGKTCAS